MKKSILFFAVLLLGIATRAQNNYNLVIFSDDGEPFYAYVNGIRQNDKAETNIRVTGLNSEALSIRVEFENKALPKLKQNMMPESGFEHTVIIRRNKKQEIKMQYFGKVELAEAPKSNATSIAYHTDEHPVSESTTVSSTTSGTTRHNTTTETFNTNTSTGDNNTTITTTTSTAVRNNADNVSINLNMGTGGVSMNVNTTEPNTTVHSTTSTTVTTTSSSSNGSVKGKNPNPKAEATTQVLETNDGSCKIAMSKASYDQLKKSIESKPFSDTKMSTAKIGTKNSCLSVAQVKGICALFSMDEDKLTFAKYAYSYCMEKANFYQVADVFSFSTTTEDLNKFLEEN